MINSVQIFRSFETKGKLIEMMFSANKFIMDIFVKSNINVELKADKKSSF